VAVYNVFSHLFEHIVIENAEEILLKEEPDIVIVYSSTNSALGDTLRPLSPVSELLMSRQV